jgi:hypothetical protein
MAPDIGTGTAKAESRNSHRIMRTMETITIVAVLFCELLTCRASVLELKSVPASSIRGGTRHLRAVALLPIYFDVQSSWMSCKRRSCEQSSRRAVKGYVGSD